MKIKVTLILIVCHFLASSQQWEWAKQTGALSGMGHDAIKANAAGDLFVSANMTYQTSHTTLSRFNPQGLLTWSTSIDGWNTALIDVSVDINNNSYVLGWFASNLVFPDTTIWEGNSWELFIAAYAPNGHRKWVKTFPNAANWGNFITNDNNGDLIFAFSKGWKLYKFDQNGNTIWQSGLGSDNYINCLQTDDDNNIYLTSTFNNSLAINGNVVYAGQAGTFDPYGFICRVTSSGSFKDVQLIKGAAITDIGIDSLKNYYCVGNYHDTLKIGQTVLSHTCTSPYDPCTRNFIAKFDTNNYCSWIKEHNSTFDQIEATRSGDCYASGILIDTLTFSPVSAYSPYYASAVYIYKLNSAGIGLWAVTNNPNTQSNSVTDMCIGGAGNIFISGIYSGQPTFGNSTLPSTQYSYYIAALNENVVPTSVKNQNKNSDLLQLYPNPSKGTIRLLEPGGAIISGVYDILGQQIEKILVKDNVETNLEEHGKGIYFIEVSREGKKEYKKVVIE